MTTAENSSSGHPAPGQAAGSQGSTRDELKSDADRLAGSAKERAGEEAEKRTGEAARAAHCTAGALEDAARHLEHADDGPAWIASAFRSAAGTVDEISNRIEGRSAEDLSRDASRFARERPMAFMAASAAAGFAAARFLRAGADYRQHDRTRNDTGGDLSAKGTAQPRSSNHARFTEATRSTNQGGLAQ